MNKKNNPLFTIVTRNHNRYLLTKTFIEEVEKIQYDNKNIIVVDDGSTDGSVKKLKMNLRKELKLYF